MTNVQLSFERREAKYLLTDGERLALEVIMSGHMLPDEHGPSTVRSVYYDTPSLLLARRSAESPTYKEKLRLRAYGKPVKGEKVFVELKKKCAGIVYKRRTVTDINTAGMLLDPNRPPRPDASQIEREISRAAMRYEGLAPRVYLAYDRTAFYERDNRDLRMTFDRRVRARWDDPRLSVTDGTDQLLEDGISILEIKTSRAMPLWLVSAISELRLKPAHWSKYGTVCKTRLQASPMSHAAVEVAPPVSVQACPLLVPQI